ncbi:MAG: CDP-alcohol phosphatidyltransferase family protein [Candidatus Doudnabacteria bacterium]|nr:CDP-alcohol phosphatidyltransferase family protein [Candidatus Doudnabacteria bacterium]
MTHLSLSKSQRAWCWKNGEKLRFTAHMLSLSRIPLGWLVWHLISHNANVWLVLLIFVVAAITDGLDGIIARLSGLTTRLGAVLDPVCDKIFVFFGLFAVWDRVWLEAATLLVLIEAFFLLVAVFSAKTATEAELKSTDEGKLKLAYECLALGFYIIDLRITGHTLLVFALVFAVLSGIQKIIETRTDHRT